MLTKRIEKAIQDKAVVILDNFDNEFIPLRLLQRVVGSIPTRLVKIMTSLDYEPVFAGRKIKGWNVKAEQFYIVIGDDKPVAAFSRFLKGVKVEATYSLRYGSGDVAILNAQLKGVCYRKYKQDNHGSGFGWSGWLTDGVAAYDKD